MFRLVMRLAEQLTEDVKGAAGNIGLYAAGVPVGLLTDTKGPRISMLLGAALMGLGYFPIYLGMLRRFRLVGTPADGMGQLMSAEKGVWAL